MKFCSVVLVCQSGMLRLLRMLAFLQREGCHVHSNFVIENDILF